MGKQNKKAMTDQEEKIDKFHRYFGVEFNNAIYPLSEKENLTDVEKEKMIQTAHAAIIHWQSFSKSTIANTIRGYYTLTKAYIAVGEITNALKYANLNLKLTFENEDKLCDWDIAYVYEITARVYAMDNNKADFDKYYALAKKQESIIKDPEDLKYFSMDFNGGNWFGFA